MNCTHCGKRLSRKAARQIEGVVMCSSCLFAPRARCMDEAVPDVAAANLQFGVGDFVKHERGWVGYIEHVESASGIVTGLWEHRGDKFQAGVDPRKLKLLRRAASVDTRRMAETGTGSGRSPSGAVTPKAADALNPSVHSHSKEHP